MFFRNAVDADALHPGCQGMNIVSSFMLRILSLGRQVLGNLLVLMHPPYFLNELRQCGFPKLKLATSDWSSLVQAPSVITAETFLAVWLFTILTSLLRLTQEYMQPCKRLGPPQPRV
jgi:hypothetical protein